MEEEKKQKRQRIAVFYNNTYKEITRLRYTRIQIAWVIAFIFIVLFIIDFFIISYSPIKYFIPNYPNKEIITTMRLNDVMLDSIQQQLKTKNQYISNLTKILKGDSLDNYNPGIIADSNPKFPQIKNVHSREDSLLRQEVEEQEMFSAKMGNQGIDIQSNLYQLNFFPPVKGVVSNEFNPTINHLGVDIVASPNQLVLASLDGTIINASWTVATGYTIQIQHKSNIVTAYKHLADIVVKEGQKVKAGQPIGTVGNTGELSTGPHLHFELWQNGTPLNAEEYISFK